MTAATPHRFVFVRHAQAACNVLGPDALIETYDPAAPLTPEGRIQAQALARAWPDALLGQRIFCSPLRRAQETAAPLARRYGLPVQDDQRLEEMRVAGRFSPPLSLAAWDALLARRVEHPGHAVWAGMESLADQDERVRTFLRERHARRGQEPVTLIVSHAMTIELALLALLGLDLDTLSRFRFRLSNAAIHVVENERLGAPARLLLVNAKNHLDAWL